MLELLNAAQVGVGKKIDLDLSTLRPPDRREKIVSSKRGFHLFSANAESGQPIGIGLKENLIKECAEEAAIPRDLAERAIPVGAISYTHEMEDGLKPDVQFVYDLELPGDFVPHNTDGELEDFYLWPIEQVAETVRDTTEFKFNCNLVIIDFLVRHGLIPPEDPDYLDIVAGLHR